MIMKPYDLIVAADPGMEGAIVIIQGDGSIMKYTVAIRKKDGGIDLDAEYDFVNDTINDFLLSPEKGNSDTKVYFAVENVHPLYLVSAKSTGTLMQSKGELLGMFTVISKQYDGGEVLAIAPKSWQKIVWAHQDKVFEGGKINTKKTSLNAAMRLWPGETFLKNDRCKVPHDGIVDALLIAMAARSEILKRKSNN